MLNPFWNPVSHPNSMVQAPIHIPEKTKVISFDCYGTLIDWRTGISASLLPFLKDFSLDMEEEEIYRLFVETDRECLAGSYKTYRELLREYMRVLSGKLGFRLYPEEEDLLLHSLPNWKPFPETTETLSSLGEKYNLAILSNIDDDLFSYTRKHLGTGTIEIISSYQLKSYKPAQAHFREVLDRFGIPKEQLFHIAGSFYHDISPCLELGIPHAWINRYGENPPASLPPPLYTFPSLHGVCPLFL